MKDLAEIIHFGKNTSLSTKCQQNVLSVQFYKNFKGPSFYGYLVIVLTDQISLPDCLYFSRYWAICVLQLFAN